MGQEFLNYEDVLGKIPEDNESYNAALDTIPIGESLAWTQGEEASVWEKTKQFTGGMLGLDPTPEEQQAKSANIIAISEHTGQSFKEVVQENLNLENPVPIDQPLTESIKARAENIKIVAKSSYDIQTAGSSFSKSASYGDVKGMEEAITVYHESLKNREEVGGPQTKFEIVAYGLSDIVSNMAAIFAGAKEEATAGMAVAVGLAATGVGAPAAIPAAALGAGYGLRESMWTSFHGLQAMKKIDEGYSVQDAYWTSVPAATALMYAEVLKVGAVVKNIPGLGVVYSKAMGKAVNSVEVDNVVKWAAETMMTGGKEIATEVAQTVIEVLDRNISNSLMNELKGTNLATTTKEEALQEVKDTIIAIGPAALILGGAGAGTGYVASTINRKAAEKQQEAVIASFMKRVEDESAALEAELQDMNGNTITPQDTVVPPNESAIVTNENGDVQPSMPITEEEIAVQETGFDESPINEEAYQEMILDDSIDPKVVIENDIALAHKTGDPYGDFVAGLRQVLPKEQVKVVEGLIKARARATNRTKEQFADDHRLSLRIGEGSDKGSVQFIKDGETIVRAFQNTDLKAVTHEIAHVFRRDLSKVEIASAESAFGVKDGNWTVEQEEAFADSFVQFLANGKAPTEKLAKIFTKLKSWIAETYRTIKGEKVNVSPEMDQIFNTLLASQSNVDYQHKVDKSRQKTEMLFQKAPKEVYRSTHLEKDAPFKPLGDVVTEIEAVKHSLLQLVNAAKKAHREGNKEGYDKATSAYKAIIERTRTRTATNKSKSNFRKKIRKLAKKMRPYKKSGRPKGKFTADFQDDADVITYIMSKTQKEAVALQKQVLKYNKNVPKDQLTSFDKLAEAMLDLKVNARNMNEVALQQLHGDLKQFYDSGISLGHKEIAKRQEELKRVSKMMMDSTQHMAEKRGLSMTERGDYDEKVSGVKQALTRAAHFVVYDFHGMMEILDMGLTDKLGEGPAQLFTETLLQENAEKRGKEFFNTAVLTGAAEIYGQTDVKMMERYFHEEEKQGAQKVLTYKITKKNEDGLLVPTGETNTLTLSKSEIRNMWMELADEQVMNTWQADGLTDTDLNIIRSMLNDEDVKFVDFQLKFYDTYFDSINEVYRDTYSTDLIKRKAYSPITRDTELSSKEGFIEDLLNDIGQQKHGQVSPTFMITRVNSKLVTKSQSDLEKMNHYIRQMEHFKAFAPKIFELRTLFAQPELHNAIVNTHGSYFMKLIEGAIDDMARNGTAMEGETTGYKIARTIRGNLTRSIIGAKPLAAAKQLGSALAFTEVMPVKDFMSGMMEYLKHPKKYANELNEISEFVKFRGGSNMDRDIADLMRSSQYKSIMGKKLPPGFNDMVMMFVKAGDIGAIYAGGSVYYHYLRKQGMSQKDAVFEMEKVARNTQQSAELGSLSTAQRAGEYWKLFTMFTSSQRQYTQRVALAMQAKANDRMTAKEASKMAMIYFVALPVLFQATASAFGGDEEDWRAGLRAMMASPLAAVPILNYAWNWEMSRLIEGHTYGRGIMSLAIGSPVEQTLKGFNKIILGKVTTYEEMLIAMRQLVAVGEYLGIPTRSAANVAIGVQDVARGNIAKGVLEIAGQSPYAATKRTD